MDEKIDDPYKVEVIADSSGEWVGNGLRFKTPDEAKVYAENLMMRWTLVRQWRVVDIRDKGVVFSSK